MFTIGIENFILKGIVTVDFYTLSQQEFFLFNIVFKPMVDQNISDPDAYFLKQKEPIRSCLLALKEIILSQDKEITFAIKYGMPFFCFKNKMFCYLWFHKVFKQPYLGIVEGRLINHPNLIIEKRERMKILLLDPEKDLPLKRIESILKKAIGLYKSGQIKTKP